MQKSAKYILSVAAVLLLIVAGTFLPGALALGGDRVIIGQIRSEPLDTAELSSYVNVPMVDKVSLLGQPGGTMSVSLRTGAVYDQDTIRIKFREELQKLYDLGLYPRRLSGEFDRFSSGVTLRIQNDAPAINMVLWEIAINADNLNGVFYVDDQTGKILSFSFSGTGHSSFAYTEDLVAAWASYLGTDVRNTKRAADPDEPQSSAVETRFQFELFTGPRGVGGQLSSSLHSAPGRTNRWSLQY